MKHASEDIRRLIIDACKSGKITKKQASEITGYSTVTIWHWCKKEQYSPNPRGHRHSVFNEKEQIELKEFLKVNKDATLKEIKEYFGKDCALSTIHQTLTRMGLKQKHKSSHADERDDKGVARQREKFKG